MTLIKVRERESMNLFIDTNIYLNFYHFTNEDIEELKKLTVAIKSRKILLFITEQVKREFKRNRENKIADALKKFNGQNIPVQFPRICKEYKEFHDLRNAVKTFEEKKSKIIIQLKEDIQKKCLPADNIISDLFEKAELIEIDKLDIKNAKNRFDLGDPPGKNGSYGDAINWEALLKGHPINENLSLITDDQDYISKINDNRLCEFLNDEWERQKKSKITLYRRLSDFFREKYPSIKLASELDKEFAISNLVNSLNFDNTHLAIAKLSGFTNFTNSEVERIVEASISNTQICWINKDSDVKDFMQNIIIGKEKNINVEKLKSFKEIYGHD